MSPGEVPPDWRLPPGVNAPLWRYAHSPRLAESESAYFANHPLFQTDTRTLNERFVEPGRLVDLGCGTGRLALHFARKRFPVVAVELSAAMLDVLGRQASAESLAIGRVRADLCRLGFLPDATFDYALSMFSTLGMIRGPSARRRALREAARLLRPGGRLALHAHNIWLNAYHREGRRWIAAQLVKALLGRPDAGDRRMLYRGIPEMEVHLYRWGELRRDLRHAGFRIEEAIPIEAATAQDIRLPWLAPSIRAGGWIVFARR